MSQEVLDGQKWLNQTYGGRAGYISVEETGLPGTAMSQALVSAMQIELGMSTVTGVVAEQTMAACDASPLSRGTSNNRVRILQYGLYSKGYDPGSANGTFDTATENAVLEIQDDAGLSGSQVSGLVKGMQVKAVLGVDEYKLVPGGDSQVRNIQRSLNQQYLDYSGLCAADGVYGRSTATQLIFALQAEEGLPVSIANGNFGPTTKTWCPDLGTSTPQYGYGNVQYSQSQLTAFTRLVQFALYCVGIDRYTGASGSKYDPGSFTGSLSSSLNALHSFQSDYALAQRNMVGLDEWMALLVSTGNPNREGTVCDCATQLTSAKANALVGDGYSIVGRYLTGTVGAGSDKRPKNLTAAETQRIFDAGLNLFCIFQDDEDWWQEHDDLSDYFGYERGYSDANKAISAAKTLGIPYGEIIYFAVDYDYMEGEVWQKVVPHFRGIRACMTVAGNPYKIGIYSARNTCGIVSAQELASSSFVSDMSTGYSGNLGYPLPGNWAFDQILEYTLGSSDGSFGVDKGIASGRYEGFDHVDNDQTLTPISSTIFADTATTSDLEASKIAKVYGGVNVGCFGPYYAGGSNPWVQYELLGTCAASLLNSPTTPAKRIKKVRIEVIAGEGVTFPVAPIDHLAGCAPKPYVPPSKDPMTIESFALDTALSLIHDIVADYKPAYGWAWDVAEFTLKLLSMVGTDESVVTNTKIVKEFSWEALQSQTAQTLPFTAIEDKNTSNHSFTVRYLVYTELDTVVSIEKVFTF